MPFATITHPDLGDLWVETRHGALAAVRFDAPGADAVVDGSDPSGALAWLRAYLAGERALFDGPRVETGTAFQRAVWDAVRAVPYGEVRSYADIAASLGRPGAERAVGAANGANPWLVVVPCHRVTGASGKLTGYAGGVDRKAWLLRHEGALLL